MPLIPKLPYFDIFDKEMAESNETSLLWYKGISYTKDVKFSQPIGAAIAVYNLQCSGFLANHTDSANRPIMHFVIKSDHNRNSWIEIMRVIHELYPLIHKQSCPRNYL